MRSLLRNIVKGIQAPAGLLALILAISPQIVTANPAPGGSFIRNFAEASFFNPSLGIVERVYSNTVEAQVAKIPALEVFGYSDIQLSRGAMGQYYFDVENTGNIPLSTQFTVDDVDGATMTSNGNLVPDFNSNGRIDSDEITFDLSTPVNLDGGERLQLIYEFRVSSDAPVDTRLSSVLRVEAMSEEGVALNGEAVAETLVQSAALELEKEQAVAEGVDAAFLTYTLRLRNNSEVDAAAYDELDGEPITIDGQRRTGVLVRDTIPRNTVFDSIVYDGGTTPLFHIRGTAPHAYRTTVAATQYEDIDAVAFFIDGDFPVGRSADPMFSVRLPAELGKLDVTNTASTYLGDSADPVVLASNTVFYRQAAESVGSLRFNEPISGDDQLFGSPGSDTRLRLVSGGCNVSDTVDNVTVIVRSILTGDVESIVATETGANTGVFVTAPLPMAQMSPAVAGDQVMATDLGDTVVANATCAGEVLEDLLVINPGNFLFNSVTNAAVDGAVIALLDAASGIEVDREVTDQRGFFAFGDVPAGNYYYDVIDAPMWVFPSVREANPGMGRNVTNAGFGETFEHGGGMLFVSDIPVDPFYGTPLSLDKSTDRSSVTSGEFVIYTLNFTNNMHQALVGGEILDRPTYGITLVPGTVTLNGEPLVDPQRTEAGDLRFDVGLLEPLSSHELTYAMQFTAAAREGRIENSAILSGRQAGTGTLRQSQTARTMVTLDNSGGVFARQGTVLGSVFMDCDADGVRDYAAREPGIPGVRIVTQEGLSVVTDIDGKYSLFGLRPLTHAFLVQQETLPIGTTVRVTRTNDLMRGGSRLIPLKKGEVRTENFAVTTCTPEALNEVARRREAFESERQATFMDAADLPIDGQRTSVRSARTEAGIATTTYLTPGIIAAQAVERSGDVETLAQSATKAGRRQPLQSIIRSLDNAPGFIDFENGASVDRATQNIRVKGKADLALSLSLNGRELGASRVGERTRWEKRNVQAMEYIAIKLAPGENTLTLVGRDDFGIIRVREVIRISAPGKPARFEIIVPETASANPVSTVPVVVRVLDAGGRLVPASGTVTLSARRSQWDVTDIRTGTPGVQAYLDNGEATFGMFPPQVAGPDVITVRGAFGKAEARITFTPELEERVMIGVIEGAVALGSGGDAVLEEDHFNSFEDTTTGIRGELFLKGVIRGDALLTLRYNSDRDTEDRLFRDIRGDEYYPVYGDDSERGYDAQSSSNLYVKVEKGRSHFLYGDIAIEPEANSHQLGGMRRVATGAKAHWENDRVSISVFAARTAQEQVVQEIAGRGISGPYDLHLSGYIEGSERVEVIVRQAEGGDVLATTTMRRGSDYLLDFFRDTITFDAPVRQFDLDGNPVSIRVTFEAEAEDADRYWLYGGEANFAVSDRSTVGVRTVNADAPLGNPAREKLNSAYFRYEDRGGGVLEAEAAHSKDDSDRSDAAARFSYEVQSETRHFSFEAFHSGQDFKSKGGIARAGTSQVRLRFGTEIDMISDVGFSAEYVRDQINDSENLTFDVTYSQQLRKHLRGDIGLEFSRRESGAATEEEAALIVGAHWTPGHRPGTVIDAKLRAPLGVRDGPAELTLGMYREPIPGWRVFNEAELHFGDGHSLTRQTMGFSYELNEWLTGRTEFARNGLDDDTTLVQGASVNVQYNDVRSFTASVEHAHNLEREESELTSVALGLKWGWGNGDWVADTDFDTTWEESGRTHYANIGVAGRLTPTLTVLGRTRLSLDFRNDNEFYRMRSRVGAAYRPMDAERLEVLAWYEHRLEQKQNKTQTRMWSLDASYEATDDLRINGKYAGQHQEVETDGGITAATTTQLLQAGLNYEFLNDRFQVGLNAAHLWDRGGNSVNGVGPELGFVPRRGILLAIDTTRPKGSLRGRVICTRPARTSVSTCFWIIPFGINLTGSSATDGRISSEEEPRRKRICGVAH